MTITSVLNKAKLEFAHKTFNFLLNQLQIIINAIYSDLAVGNIIESDTKNRIITLLNKLIEARGDDCFLETEWDSHRLFVIPKNPRL